MPKKDKPEVRRAQVIIHSEVTETGEVKPTSVPVQGPTPGKIITILQEGGHFQKGDKMRAQAATARDAVLLALQKSLDNPQATDEQRAELARVFSILLDALETLEIKRDGENVKIDFTLFDNSRKNEVMAAIQSQPAKMIIRHLLPPLQQKGGAGALEPEPEPATGKKTRKRVKEEGKIFRRPKALAEQMILPLRLSIDGQLTLFNDLPSDMQESLNKTKAQLSFGLVDITPEEERALMALTILLHEKSQTKDQNKPDYYTGNKEPKKLTVKIKIPEKKGFLDQDTEELAPVLHFSLYEFTQKFHGAERPVGDVFQGALKALLSLKERRFFMRYKKSVINKIDRTKVSATITVNEPLILSITTVKAEKEKEGKIVFQKMEITLTLNPILRHEISKSYINYPTNIQQRVQEAWGRNRISICVSKLRDYLLTEQWRGRAEISLSKLYKGLQLEKLVAQRKTKEARALLERAATLWQKIGLLQAWQILPNADGGEKAVFEINKKWPIE